MRGDARCVGWNDWRSSPRKTRTMDERQFILIGSPSSPDSPIRPSVVCQYLTPNLLIALSHVCGRRPHPSSSYSGALRFSCYPYPLMPRSCTYTYSLYMYVYIQMAQGWMSPLNIQKSEWTKINWSRYSAPPHNCNNYRDKGELGRNGCLLGLKIWFWTSVQVLSLNYGVRGVDNPQ